MTEWHPLRSLETTTDGCKERLSWKQLDQSAEKVGRMIANTSPATMPTLNHSSMADYDDVYEPSDDTYLLIDAIKHELFSEHSFDINDTELGGDCDSEDEDDEEKMVCRAALKCYHTRCTRIHSGDPVDKAQIDNDRTIAREFAQEMGYSTSQSAKLESRIRQLRRLEQIQCVMEIGTGSGIPITYLSKRLLLEKPGFPKGIKGNENLTDALCKSSKSEFSVIATDLNPLALAFAQKTARENGVVLSETCSDEKGESNTRNVAAAKIRSIDFVECDLATPLLEEHSGAIDVLVFNPPYVPTEDSEICGTGIAISWAGGLDGRRVVDRALPQIASLLRKPSGVCYMITVDDNKPSELAALLQTEYGLTMVPVVRRRARNEYLSVQKISWSPSVSKCTM